MANNQKWLFLYEEMSSTNFIVKSKNFDDVAKAGFSLESILGFLGIGLRDPQNYNFFISSNSMKAAVQLLSSKSVAVTYGLYCGNDEVVTIIVRPAEDPSPNASQTPSAHVSLRERRKISGRQSLQTVFVRPPIQSKSSNLDPESMEPVSLLPEKEKIVLDLGKGNYETFSASYLLGWIMAEVSKGTAVDEIVVTNLTTKGRPLNVKLDKDIWVRSLLRGPHKGKFLEIWNASSEKAFKRSDALNQIHEKHPYFPNNAKIFSQDLKLFGSRPEARSRLLGTNHPFFLGEPYFSPAAVERILAIPFEPSTLQGHLDGLMEKKAERGQTEELCASHDLAPIFLKAFGIEWDNFKKEKLNLQRTKDVHGTKKLKHQSTMATLSKAFSKLLAKDEPKEEKK